MKNIFAISLLVLYINSATELHEFLRLPILFEHFQEHKQKYGKLSFMDFLAMHYNTSTSHDDHDNDLPFKNPVHTCLNSLSGVCDTHIVTIEMIPDPKIDHSSVYTEAFIHSQLSEIFQPPRIG